MNSIGFAILDGCVLNRSYTLKKDGRLLDTAGRACNESIVDAQNISVPHLIPHVETFSLTGEETVKIIARYSCHCWSIKHDPELHAGRQQVADGQRIRVFDEERFAASLSLSNLIQNLPENSIYVTRSDRNYGVYNALLRDEQDNAYTAYFRLLAKKGKFEKVRYKLELFVESAYLRPQPEPGSKTNFKAIVSKAFQGKMVKYRR